MAKELWTLNMSLLISFCPVHSTERGQVDTALADEKPWLIRLPHHYSKHRSGSQLRFADVILAVSPCELEDGRASSWSAKMPPQDPHTPTLQTLGHLVVTVSLKALAFVERFPQAAQSLPLDAFLRYPGREVLLSAKYFPGRHRQVVKKYSQS